MKASYPKLEQRSKRLLEFFGNRSIGKIRREDAIKLRDELRNEITYRKTKRSSVDFSASRIHFRNTKTAHDRFVGMGMELRQLLYGLPRLEGCEYVFPNPRTGQPYGHFRKKYGRRFPQFPRKAWDLIRKRAMLLDAGSTPYTFRRTAATTLAKNLGLHEAQEFLGHAEIATTRIYAAVTSDTYDRAAEVLERKIKQVNGGTK